MPTNQGGDAGEVVRIDRVPLGLEVLDDGLNVDGVPQGDDIEHEAECAELLLLAFPVVGGELATTAVADPPGEAVAEFLPVELDENAPAFLAIVDVVEHVERLDDTTKFGENTASITLSAFALDSEASAATRDESSDLFMYCHLGG